ncbi:MAG: type I-U CRISPR-associated protein Csx17 [bacterium]|nr:type I-U CRISPR-associated protein Csx17 [bacterium]
MNTVHLRGCRAEPLLSYLAGLGVARLVAEQLDPEVSARWDGDHLAIAGEELDDASLVEFFAENYRPTPAVAPWNSGGGFQDEGKLTSPAAQKIVDRVRRSGTARLDLYREAIAAADEARRRARCHGLTDGGKVLNSSGAKAQLIELCRSMFPDGALAWLDASVVLLDDDVAYPLILGTGGNIGRMDLSVNFLKHLDAVGLLEESEQGRSGPRRSNELLCDALFRSGDARLERGTAGQFDPGGKGGPNSSYIGDGRALTNPWTFVLGIEGAMVFASAAARRLSVESQTGASRASMPFTVAATEVGYGSASAGETLKGELWAPLWRDELSYREVRHLISEGRSQWGRRQARSGLDFVRATATLGIDRSIDEFVRYLIGERDGQSPLAVPVGRFKIADRVRPEAEILRQLDDWLFRARSNTAPAAINAALNSLDRAQFDVARLGGARCLHSVLAVLADAEQAAARSSGYRKDRRLEPIARLSAREWVPVLNDDSVEFRIAAGLASLSDRVTPGRPRAAEAVGGSLATLLRPIVRTQFGVDWAKGGARVPNFGRRPLFEVLSDVVGARAALACAAQPSGEAPEQAAGLPFAFDYGLNVNVGDIGRLLCGQVDEERLGVILSGLLLLEWRDAFAVVAACLRISDDPVARLQAASEPAYVALAPFFAGRLPVAPSETEPNPKGSVAVRPRPEWIGAIRTGSANTAARSAAQLLRGRGWKLIIDGFERTDVERGRLATALLLHLGRRGGDERQIRFLLNQQSAVDTRWSANRESQEPIHEQA